MTLKSETDAAAGVLRAKGASRARKRVGGPALADPTAREFLRRADPVLRDLIDARPTSTRGLGWTSCRRSTLSARSSFKLSVSSCRSA